MENLFLIATSDDFSSNVQNSKEKLENEFRILEREIDEGIQIVNWIYQLKARLAEVVKIIENVQQKGNMTQQQLWDLGSALFSYEKQGDKRYGIRELIERGRRKLEISKETEGPEKENLNDLEQGCQERLRFIEQRKDSIKEIERKLKEMRNEVDELESSSARMSKSRLQGKLEDLQQEYEQIMSENGELYNFFSNFRSIDFEYKKYKSKVKN